MEKDRRKRAQRGSDLFMAMTTKVLVFLEMLSRGEDADFDAAYAELVGVKDRLGRREADHKTAEELCAAVRAIATSVTPRVTGAVKGGEEQLRRVRLTKVSRRRPGDDTSVMGWEMKRPALGKSYLVYTDKGSVFRTSVVVKMVSGYIRTRNSAYQIDLLEDR
jgi:hypothetical protein